MKKFVGWLLCLLGNHSPKGPDNEVSFQMPSGRYHPVYWCRRCNKAMLWRERGGWDVK